MELPSLLKKSKTNVKTILLMPLLIRLAKMRSIRSNEMMQVLRIIPSEIVSRSFVFRLLNAIQNFLVYVCISCLLIGNWCLVYVTLHGKTQTTCYLAGEEKAVGCGGNDRKERKKGHDRGEFNGRRR